MCSRSAWFTIVEQERMTFFVQGSEKGGSCAPPPTEALKSTKKQCLRDYLTLEVELPKIIPLASSPTCKLALLYASQGATPTRSSRLPTAFEFADGPNFEPHTEHRSPVEVYTLHTTVYSSRTSFKSTLETNRTGLKKSSSQSYRCDSSCRWLCIPK
ncbi:hypothetical protein AFLA_002583 [Aspergillus flavus NRRL3357]|nr:hypothetical protein AFLA_002583 [Aspergillus flavus NRRL3357]